MNIVAAFAGDPIARESTYADVLVEREREKRRMEQDLQAALAEGYPGKPDHVASSLTASGVVTATQPRWIRPTSRQTWGDIAIAASGELRLRKHMIRRLQNDETALYVRIAAQEGHLWIEPCRGDDPYARKVRGSDSGEVSGGSLRRELAEAGFGPGTAYELEQLPGGCWVARVER